MLGITKSGRNEPLPVAEIRLHRGPQRVAEISLYWGPCIETGENKLVLGTLENSRNQALLVFTLAYPQQHQSPGCELVIECILEGLHNVKLLRFESENKTSVCAVM